MTSVFLTSLLSLQSEVAAKHQTNVMASLAVRLEKARVAGNLQLLALLQQEHLQLTQALQDEQAHGGLGQWGRSMAQWLGAIGQPALPVVEQVGAPGEKVWRGYNPATGESRWAETEAQVIDWLEVNQTQTGDRFRMWGWHANYRQQMSSQDSHL